jgi:hypothetical protein
MAQFTSFTDIGQFRNVIRHVTDRCRYRGKDENGNPIFDPTATLPTITFTGTIKLHGTNSSVVMQGNEFWVQSRTRIITPESDNAGFAMFVQKNKDIFVHMITDVKHQFNATDNDIVAIMGEFCAGNIQSGVALNQLEKMFVVFAVKISRKSEGEDWQGTYYPCDNVKRCYDSRIFNIMDYKTFKLDIDFANPQNVQNDIVKLVEEVEQECPVGKAFGVSGIGEGIVWTAFWNDEQLIFKTKGEKHSVSKVKTLASIDPEVVANINEFVEYAVTENRLNQGLEQVFSGQQPDISRIGEFIKWVNSDIVKEEIDVMAKNGLEMKLVSKAISNKARLWFMEKYNNQ